MDEHVIAENLGIITDEVEALREACGFPGMWVLQFRFGAEDLNRTGYHPEGVEKNWVVYTGTHDNDTTQSWLSQQSESGSQCIRNYLKTDGPAVCRDLAGLALRAPAKWAILPMQDVLGLGGEARMNMPGTTQGNWGWRYTEDMITKETIQWLKAATSATGR
jgi:4-alpha-glucanotransferase